MPLRCSYLFFSFSRRRTMRVISTLKTVWTWGLVCLDSTMRLAMMERILDMGTSSPSCCVETAGAGALAGGVDAADEECALGAGAAGLAVCGFSRWPRMSCLVMRPAEPLPGT